MPSDEVSPRRPDAAKMRAADTDREAVAERLRDAAAEGRLSMDELEERLDAAFSAKTFADLEPIVEDLPETVSAPPRADEPLVLKAAGSNLRQTGYWVAPSEIVASTGMGNIKLDFTEAECPHKTMTVKVSAGMGNIVVVVPRGWEIQTQEMSAGMGNVVNRATDPPGQDSRLLRFSGNVTMGNLKIRYPSRFELAWKRRAAAKRQA
ncbi:DUF1707 domain-containing protein [Nocardiopsis potens]|uniref:DUF1707 domain-containing protein n=1 Tax=Nocardiopsis potens TaxID=1246458 RepID=UPI0019D38CEE|nr:DUF1707 domain-containing protein [Nocardiopsis potens]